MSISIRKKYIKYNNEKNLRAQSKDQNYPLEKNYNTNTYINPKIKIKEKKIESNIFSKEIPQKKIHIKNNSKAIGITNNINKANNKYNNNTNNNYRIIRRNYSQNFTQKKDLNNINDIISVILEHEAEKIKINL